MGRRWGGHGVVADVRVSACVPRGRRALAYALPVWSAMAKTAKSNGEQGKDRGSLLVSWEIGWRCSVDMLDRGDVLRSDDSGDVTRLRRSPFFFLFSLFSLGSGAQWTATKWR